MLSRGRPHFLQGVRCVSHLESQGRWVWEWGAESRARDNWEDGLRGVWVCSLEAAC